MVIRLLDYRGPEGQEAKSILREIRSVAASTAGGGSPSSPPMRTRASSVPLSSSVLPGLGDGSDMLMSLSGNSVGSQEIYLLDDSEEED